MLPYRSNDICIIKSIETNRSKRGWPTRRYCSDIPISQQRKLRFFFSFNRSHAKEREGKFEKERKEGEKKPCFPVREIIFFSTLPWKHVFVFEQQIDRLVFPLYAPTPSPPIHKSIPVSSLVARDNWARLPVGTDWYDRDTPIANPICVSLITP